MSPESPGTSHDSNSAEILASVTDLPRHEVERLLGKATARSRTELILGVPVGDAEQEEFGRLVDRRRNGEPLQYLEERIPFGPIEVSVDPRVLIPRPETEQLLELAIGAVERPRVIVDLGTGSGNLALALKHTFPEAVVYATDSSADAVAVAQANARDAGLDVIVLVGDLFEPLPDHLHGSVDLIVANPPYLAEGEFEQLPSEVRNHEPQMALVAGPNGDEVLASIAAEAAEWLAPGGAVVCEISEFGADAADVLFDDLDGEIRPDLSGKPRFVISRDATRD